jgi:hypothetical protein
MPEPFTIGAIVALKVNRSPIYIVVAIARNIDTGQNNSHPPNPDGQQHYYKLERNGKPAFWYHSQLMRVFNDF